MAKRNETFNKEKIKELILYLYEGYERFGDDLIADHIFNIAVRYLTAEIGLCKEVRISKNALKSKKENIIKEHVKPVSQFYEEFREKKDKAQPFDMKDAERWFKQAEIAKITKEEDKRLTEKGWKGINRPPNAYKKLGIELVDEEQGLKSKKKPEKKGD
jgi:hypothetical protein